MINLDGLFLNRNCLNDTKLTKPEMVEIDRSTPDKIIKELVEISENPESVEEICQPVVKEKIEVAGMLGTAFLGTIIFVTIIIVVVK